MKNECRQEFGLPESENLEDFIFSSKLLEKSPLERDNLTIKFLVPAY